MKKNILKAVAFMAERAVKQANNTECRCLTYQPKAPDNIKNFKK
jgi:cyclic lactone autoinducer peptide